MDRDNFFDNLGKGADPYDDDKHEDKNELVAARRARNQLAYEERVIKRVFKECGVRVNSWGYLVNECRAATGKDKLNFDWFNYAFPVFRRHHGALSGARVPKLHKIKVADLFKPVETNRFLKLLARKLPAPPFVFVFSIVGTRFVAYCHEPAPVENAVALVINRKPLISVESTWSYFQSIGSEWAERA